MNILITVCARGGSKGVPAKNICLLQGRPLIHYTLDQALKSRLSVDIVVSSDSKEILTIAALVSGIQILERPAAFATDTISKLPAIRHAVENMETQRNKKYNFIVDLDPTSPLRSIEDIQNSFRSFKDSQFDNLITASPARRSPYFNLVEITSQGFVTLSKKPDTPITCRQDSPDCYDMNASIYIWKRECLFASDRIIGDRTGIYVMPAERSVDIDHPIDFEIVEFLLKKRQGAAL